MNGILLIDKPSGWTSHDVVAKVRGVVRKETGLKKPKIGHAGTLDPLATGLLVVLVGSYCKRAQEFSKLDKEYETEVLLGKTSTTDDEEGEKTRVSNKQPTPEEVEKTLQDFVGISKQVPPAFSAVKVNGKRAYKEARAGKEVTIEPRTVTIHEIRDVVYQYPKITFTVSVGSGTYIRSLARDVGTKIGIGAYMSNLRRTKIGQFTVDESTSIEDIAPADLSDLIKPLH